MISILNEDFHKEDYPIEPFFYNREYFQLDKNSDEIFVRIIDDDILPMYWISNYGRVYSDKIGLMKTYIDSGGYVFVMLSTGNKVYRRCSIHRLILLNFHRINYNMDELQVNHKDGCKLNNTFSNLEWNNRSQNIRHAYEHGLMNHQSNITEEQAKEIIELLKLNKYTNIEIANMIGSPVTVGIVSDIKKKTSWAYLTKDIEFEMRPWRLLTPNIIEDICKYFESHPKPDNITVKEHTENAFKFYGYYYDAEIIDSARKIYPRKYYTSISKKYNF